jgi:adenylate cyclase
MSTHKLINEIEEDVKDIRTKEFTYYMTKTVPNSEDGGLTFESGTDKKGKAIDTCVLYVDIRNSVALTQKHPQLMGKVYTAFTKSVLKIAKHHEASVRNIIGDRVMVVFPSENCHSNAIKCAISINHVCKEVINKQFPTVDFKCGIGVDYGRIRVSKVGIQVQGADRTENKNLVWVGKPANIASRLTDIANKTVKEEFYNVTYEPRYYNLFRNAIAAFGLSPLKKPSRLASLYEEKEPEYLPETTKRMTGEEFARAISNYSIGVLSFNEGKFKSFERKTIKHNIPSILISERVYAPYYKENGENGVLKSSRWELIKYPIKNVKCKVYGLDVNWNLSE